MITTFEHLKQSKDIELDFIETLHNRLEGKTFWDIRDLEIELLDYLTFNILGDVEKELKFKQTALTSEYRLYELKIKLRKEGGRFAFSTKLLVKSFRDSNKVMLC